MDLRRVRAGEWITSLAGLALLISLFLSWYDGASGWEALSLLDIVLALLALVALGMVPLTASQSVPAIPLAIQALLALVAKVALIAVVIRVIAPPGDSAAREAGLWLGFASTAAVVIGAWVAMRDERLSPRDALTDLTGRPVAEAPEIETLPAPRPDPSLS